MRATAILCLCAGLHAVGCGCQQMADMTPGVARKAAHRGAAVAPAGAGESAPAGDAGVLPEPEETPHLTAIDPRKVVYTGRLRVAVSDPPEAVARAKALAEKMGGYIQQMDVESITVRVPAARFDDAVAALEDFGAVCDKAVHAQDVTEQYVDLEIRLRNAKALLTKLLALLDKAQDVKQAMVVEKEIARVRAEVERLTGRLNRLRNRVAFSTLTVHFVRSSDAPRELRVRLPFWWLHTLGLDSLMKFEADRGF